MLKKWLKKNDVSTWRTAVSALRREYTGEPLTEENSGDDPIKLFDRWFDEAAKSAMFDANSFVLSTVDSEHKPHSRIVLLKGFEENGFVFFTNYESAKCQDIFENPFVSVNFNWPELFRQLRIEGVAEKTSSEESDAYFASRPRKSNLSALASAQSSKISGREELEENYNTLDKQWAGQKEIKRPENWGGIRIKPTKFEFWQGRTGRLHDRIVFEKPNENEANWEKYRLAP